MKVVNTANLLRLAARGRRAGYNRTLRSDFATLVDPTGLHVLKGVLVHGDADCVRCEVLIKLKDMCDPFIGMLDVSLDEYNKIPEHQEV